MKRILIFFKNNVLGIVIGGMFFGSIGGVLGATYIQSRDVKYNNTNVEAAVNELYDRVCKTNPKMTEMCPNCKWVSNSYKKYLTIASQLPSDITNYTTDKWIGAYNNNRAYKVDSNNNITNLYACITNYGVSFCIEGTNIASRAKQVYDNNKNIMNAVFNDMCYETESSGNLTFSCQGEYISNKYLRSSVTYDATNKICNATLGFSMSFNDISITNGSINYPN